MSRQHFSINILKAAGSICVLTYHTVAIDTVYGNVFLIATSKVQNPFKYFTIKPVVGSAYPHDFYKSPNERRFQL